MYVMYNYMLNNNTAIYVHIVAMYITTTGTHLTITQTNHVNLQRLLNYLSSCTELFWLKVTAK